MKNYFSIIFLFTLFQCGFSQSTYYVSNLGNDLNDGSLTSPWKTLTYSTSKLNAGDVLNILAGTYAGNLNLSKSGTITQPITIQNYQNDQVIINGSGLNAGQFLMKIENKNNITVKGIKFKDFQKNNAQGLLVINSSGISILNNEFSNIDYATNAIGQIPTASQNSQPLIVFGRDAQNSVKNLTISGNKIHDCETGFSESLSINGNIDGFLISNNEVYKNTNIGIVAIGFEGECPSGAVDQARNGKIKNNVVYNNSSLYAAAGGIYVDGGKSIIIENNRSYNNDYGIEIGCENNGKIPNASASDIKVRNNLVYNNKISGIALGGYNYPTTGKVQSTKITNNTLYNNDTTNSSTGELALTYVENSTIENNIFYTNNTNKVLISSSYPNLTLQLNYNLYYLPSGSSNVIFDINGVQYTSFNAYKTATSQDGNSIFSDPQFNSAILSNLDLHLKPISIGIDKGNPTFTADFGELDYDGNNRVFNNRVDIGAYEYSTVLSSENLNTLSIKIYPNPAKDKIYLKGLKEFRYQIYSVLGQMIIEGKNNSDEIDVRKLASGSYLIIIIDPKNNILGKLKFIKG